MIEIRCQSEITEAGVALMCGAQPSVGIVTDNESGDGYDLFPVCNDHAPEEVHEAKASMAADEYAVIDLAAAAWRDTAQQALRAHAETAAELLTVNAWARNLITGE